MTTRLRPFLAQIGALGILAAGLIFLLHLSSSPAAITFSTSTAQTASVTAVTPEPAAVTTTASTSTPHTAPAAARPKPKAKKALSVQGQTVTRAADLYSTPPLPFSEINSSARAALVNIICMPRAGGSLRPVTGSGVIIDPRGVILTNAHVAQYVLLSQSPEVDLRCTIRSGSPAIPRWGAEVLYIPPIWVETHASEIRQAQPLGTGEHDYALLHITSAIDGTPLPAAFPYLPIDVRQGVAFQDDQVLLAGYPAEFLGALAASGNFYPTTSVTNIKQLLTFTDKSIDVISLGGVIEAQGGSSGGAVVNAWGKLVGIITTTSEGSSTSERDLHALTLSYINADIEAQTQFDLPAVLGGDPAGEAADFNAKTGPALTRLYIDQLQGR